MLKCVGLKTMAETWTTVTLKEKVNPMPDFQLSRFSNSFTFTNFITLTLLMKFIKRCSVPLGNPNKISEHHSSTNSTITNCIVRVIIFKIMLVSWIVEYDGLLSLYFFVTTKFFNFKSEMCTYLLVNILQIETNYFKIS